MITLAIPTDSPAVVGPLQGQWTYADWEKLPDDGNRYEIIDGVLYMTRTPSNFHQWILSRIYRGFAIPGEDQGFGFAFFAPSGVIAESVTPVEPDFMFVTMAQMGIIRNKHVYGAPALIIEILSPSNRDYDEDVKRAAYARAGVAEYGVVDPTSRAVRLYTLNADGQYGAARGFTAGDVLAFACLPGISAPVHTLFDGAPDTTL
ncbi:MAG: Uma2 family endonuclease [Anaerolineae bacterium]|nr:Uma2 family endonuclease [Anaerolineae bacterium]